jgi:prophage regulatory protein
MDVAPYVSNKLSILRFIRLPEVKQITGLGKTTLYALIKEGSFPAPVPLTGRAVGWVAEEVYQWVRDRIAEARLTPSHPAARLAA